MVAPLSGIFNGGYMPPKVHAGFLEFISHGVGNTQVWDIIKTNLMPMFYHVILPAIWFGQHDALLW